MRYPRVRWFAAGVAAGFLLLVALVLALALSEPRHGTTIVHQGRCIDVPPNPPLLPKAPGIAL